MVIDIDPSSGVPVFRQIMDQVRTMIAAGRLTAGDPLPPTRSLATELGVNPMTVSKAYGLLERDGLLERRPGRPLVVRAVSDSELAGTRIQILSDRVSDVATLARQLGFSGEEASAIFHQIMCDATKEP